MAFVCIIIECSHSVELLIQLLIQVNGPPCPNICSDAPRNNLIDDIIGSCNLNPVGVA